MADWSEWELAEAALEWIEEEEAQAMTDDQAQPTSPMEKPGKTLRATIAGEIRRWKNPTAARFGPSVAEWKRYLSLADDILTLVEEDRTVQVQINGPELPSPAPPTEREEREEHPAIHDDEVSAEDRAWARSVWDTLVKGVEQRITTEQTAVLMLAKERTIWRRLRTHSPEEPVGAVPFEVVDMDIEGLTLWVDASELPEGFDITNVFKGIAFIPAHRPTPRRESIRCLTTP